MADYKVPFGIMKLHIVIYIYIYIILYVALHLIG